MSIVRHLGGLGRTTRNAGRYLADMHQEQTTTGRFVIYFHLQPYFYTLGMV